MGCLININVMVEVLVFVGLILLELFYFRIANRFNIIDKPNQRSSHTEITLRGGGIIFYFGALTFFCISGFQYPWFFIGLTLMTIVSFLDDLLSLSNRIRLTVQFSSVLLMAYELSIFSFPWYYLLFAFIFVVGVINAYNFMDGINGMTACYSLIICILLMIANSKNHFIDGRLLSYVMISLIVFSIFNFRLKAKTFAGDVGSVSIAFILLFGIGSLIILTENFIYILFLIVYGVDAIWTIIRRMYIGENIFEAHRSHLYQYLGNEAGINKLLISFIYGLIQLGIGLLVIWIVNYSKLTQLVFSIVLILCISIIYLILKSIIIKKYQIK